MADIDELSASQIAQGVKDGSFSATEVAKATLDAVDKREGDIQAFLEISADLALAAAERTDKARAKGEPLGILAGVPCAFKDNMHLVGTHTTCASKMLENYESVFTATCVQRMLDAGATPVGKTNMDEFAFGSSTESSAFHRTNNPWDTTRVPGGSSGGSAAAVAAGEVTLSLGSDTGGSIRQPASLCGVVGMKPTYGAVSRYGVVAFGSSLDQVGPFGRSVADVALAMNALTGPGRDPYDSTSQNCPVDFLEHLEDPIEGKAVGIVPELMDAPGLTQEVKDALAGAIAALKDQGASVVEVDLPNIRSAIAAYYVIAPCEAFSNLARFDGVRYGSQEQEPWLRGGSKEAPDARCLPPRFGRLRQVLLSGAAGTHAHHPGLCQRLQEVRRDTHAGGTPHGLPLRRDERSDRDVCLRHVHDFEQHCRKWPLGLGAESKLPVSAQLQGPAFSDRRLLQFARAIERAFTAEGTVAPAFAGKGGELR